MGPGEALFLPEDFVNRVDYHCGNHTAARELLVHLPSDMSRYCHFSETLLTPSQVVHVTIHIRICRYAVAVFLAIMCTNKSGWLQEVRNRGDLHTVAVAKDGLQLATFRATSPEIS